LETVALPIELPPSVVEIVCKPASRRAKAWQISTTSHQCTASQQPTNWQT
jgi:hypothetical protein